MTTAIAHRGDWSKDPENTTDAFARAVKNGADMLELDVKLTKDGHAVILHDENLARIWGDSRRVRDLTWSEIQRIDVEGYRIPSLEEVIGSIRVPYMVDFVDLETAEVIADVLRKQGDVERFLVVTGNVPAITRVKQCLPEVTTGLTWDAVQPPSDALMKSTGVSFFNPYYRLLNRRLVDDMHQRGYQVSCWTVDVEADMGQMIQLGVDAIVSNQLTTLVKTIHANHS